MRKLHGNDGMCMGTFLECVQKSFEKVVQNPSEMLSDSCLASDDPADLSGLGLDLGTQPLKMIGYYNYVGMAIAVAMCIMLLVMYISHRPGYFGGGKFIQFTLHLRAHIVYKVLAATLALFSFMLIIAVAWIGYRVLHHKGFETLHVYVVEFAGQVIGLAYTGVAYVMPDTKIDDKFKSADFTPMTFKRPLSDISIDSLVFCKHVSHAALSAAATGSRTDIDKYTGDEYTSADAIIEFVKRPPSGATYEALKS